MVTDNRMTESLSYQIKTLVGVASVANNIAKVGKMSDFFGI